MQKHTAAGVSGFALLEAMVALFVLALGALGYAAMQMNGLRMTESARMQTNAVLLAYEIADSLRSNRQAAAAGAYDGAVTAGETPTTCSDACTPSELAQAHYDAWGQVLSSLPSGAVNIAREQDGDNWLMTVTLCWDETRGSVSDTRCPVVADSAALRQYVIRVLL